MRSCSRASKSRTASSTAARRSAAAALEERGVQEGRPRRAEAPEHARLHRRVLRDPPVGGGRGPAQRPPGAAGGRRAARSGVADGVRRLAPTCRGRSAPGDRRARRGRSRRAALHVGDDRRAERGRPHARRDQRCDPLRRGRAVVHGLGRRPRRRALPARPRAAGVLLVVRRRSSGLRDAALRAGACARDDGRDSDDGADGRADDVHHALAGRADRRRSAARSGSRTSAAPPFRSTSRGASRRRSQQTSTRATA